MERRDADGGELSGQPSILSLLTPPSSGASRELDKKTLLAALMAFKKGDFSVRLPLDLEGMDGKIADAFNDVIELNQRLSGELERLSRVVGKEGKISQRASMGSVTGAWATKIGAVNQLISRSRTPRQRNRPRDRRRRQGRSFADDGAGDRRPSARRRIPAHRQNGQHHGGPARLVRRRSDARGPRSGYRRKARRPGEGERRRRYVEGPDRLRELHGRQPHRPGA